MLLPENATSLLLTKAMLSKKRNFDKCFSQNEITADLIKRISRSSYIVFDLQLDSTLNVKTDDETEFSWLLCNIRPDIRETLLHACLNDKIIVGHDLAFQYGLAYAVTDTCMPFCTLDTLLIARMYGREAYAPIYAINPLDALYELTSESSVAAALEAVLLVDLDSISPYFDAVEKIPFALADILGTAIHDFMRNPTEDVSIDCGLLMSDDRTTFSIINKNNVELATFDVQMCELVEREFDLAIDSAIQRLNALGAAL